MTNKYVEKFRNDVKELLDEQMMIQMPKPQVFFSPKQTLDEMATVCDKSKGFSFIVEVYSNDHNPPHMHFKYKDTNIVAKIAITDNMPRKVEDIEIINDVVLSKTQLKEIVKWASSDTGFSVPYWTAAQLAWTQLHPKN